LLIAELRMSTCHPLFHCWETGNWQNSIQKNRTIYWHFYLNYFSTIYGIEKLKANNISFDIHTLFRFWYTDWHIILFEKKEIQLRHFFLDRSTHLVFCLTLHLLERKVEMNFSSQPKKMALFLNFPHHLTFKQRRHLPQPSVLLPLLSVRCRWGLSQ